jgi:hypothetical protein
MKPMSEENTNEKPEYCSKNDLLHPIKPGMIDELGFEDGSCRKGDIWWMFHWELSKKASMVRMAAEALADAVGNIHEQTPDEELSKIRAVLQEQKIEHNLKAFQEHFQKMEELLKTVREMQSRIF